MVFIPAGAAAFSQFQKQFTLQLRTLEFHTRVVCCLIVIWELAAKLITQGFCSGLHILLYFPYGMDTVVIVRPLSGTR
jgi:hypothetical protein